MVTAGPATDAERANLARRLAAAQNARGGVTAPAQAPAAGPTQAPPPAAGQAPPAAAWKTPPAAPPATSWRPSMPTLGGGVQTAAGFLLGLFVWGWVVMPFLHSGPTGVRNVLRAKFLNKGPDGSWLP